MKPRTIQLLLLLSVLSAAVPALAWTQALRDGADGAMVPLTWETPAFMYSISARGSDDMEPARVEEAVDAAFRTWQEVPCAGVRFEKTSPATVDEVAAHTDRGNVNLIVFREEVEEWHWELSAVAQTVIHYDGEGRIADVDIEINGAFFTFADLSSAGTDAGAYDLRSVLTHEIGHALGLDHSADESAVMYGATAAGNIFRDLSADDEEGICSLYPASAAAENIPEPLCGLDLDGTSSSCATQADVAETVDGCGLAPLSRQVHSLFSLL